MCVCGEPPAGEKIVAIPQSAAMPCDALGMATIFELCLVYILVYTCTTFKTRDESEVISRKKGE